MRRSPILWTMLLAFALSTLAHATPIDPVATLLRIEDAQRAGALDAEAALVMKFSALFDPLGAPAAFTTSAGGTAVRPFCATPLILQAVQAWPTLSANARQTIGRLVVLPDPARLASDPGRTLASGAGVATQNPNTIVTPNSYQTEHFNILWGDSGGVLLDNVERLGQYLEESWAVEVEDLDYPAPSYTDQYLMDIYVGNTGDGAPTISFQGAYTTIYQNSPYMAFIVIHPDILTSAAASQEIAAHEFFHTLQFGIVLNHGWRCYSLSNDDQWFWEATATWAEDEVYPNNNSYVYFVEIYTRYPEESLHSQVDFMFPYSRALFFKYLSEYQGGVDSVRQVWTACDPRGTLLGIDAYLEEQGSSLRAGFVDFMNRNAVMDYVDGVLYQDVTITATHYNFPVDVPSIEDADDRPRYLGANFLVFEPQSYDPTTLTLGFDGADSQNGDAVTWGVGVVLERSGSEYESGRMSLDDQNRGQIDIPGFGSEYRRVYMIPAVVKWNNPAATTKGVDYRYIALLSTGDDDDDATDDDSAGDDDDDDNGDGCGWF